MKDKKIQIHEFDPVLYPRQLWICINPTEEGIAEIFRIDKRHNKEGIDFTSDGCYAEVVPVAKKENGLLGILVSFHGKNNMSFKVMAHESIHVADYIFEECKMMAQEFSECNEQYAYLVGWIAECFYKVKTNKFA